MFLILTTDLFLGRWKKKIGMYDENYNVHQFGSLKKSVLMVRILKLRFEYKNIN